MSLLVGDATTSYSNANSLAATGIEAYQFTASKTGTVAYIQLRTNGTVNTGVTSVKMGIYTDNANVPNLLLSQGSYTGTPPINSWVQANMTSPFTVVTGTVYWIAFLPIGGTLNYSTSVASGGTNATDASTTGFATLPTTTGWITNVTVGPMGLQGNNNNIPLVSIRPHPFSPGIAR